MNVLLDSAIFIFLQPVSKSKKNLRKANVLKWFEQIITGIVQTFFHNLFLKKQKLYHSMKLQFQSHLVELSNLIYYQIYQALLYYLKH